jgi:hypothetical protein
MWPLLDIVSIYSGCLGKVKLDIVNRNASYVKGYKKRKHNRMRRVTVRS